MGYNGKRRPEEGHPCIGHRGQSERVSFRRATTLVAKFPFWRRCPQLLPASSAPGKLRLRQTDVPDLEAECALTQKNGIGVEGTLIPMSVTLKPDPDPTSLRLTLNPLTHAPTVLCYTVVVQYGFTQFSLPDPSG